GYVDGAVDAAAAAWGFKIGEDLVRRYASDRHHEMSRAEGLRNRRLPPTDERASGDQTRDERQDAASALLSPDGTRADEQRRADGRDSREGRRRTAHLLRLPGIIGGRSSVYG